MTKRTAKAALLIESDPGLADAIREMFSHQDPHAFDLTHVCSLKDAEEHLAEHTVDVVLLDFSLTYAPGLDAVSRARAAAPQVPIVLLCSEEEEQVASET